MTSIWQLWDLWQYFWIEPWRWATYLICACALYSVKWKVKTLPFAIAFIVWASCRFSFDTDQDLVTIFPSLCGLASVLLFIVYLNVRLKLKYEHRFIAAMGLCAAVFVFCLWIGGGLSGDKYMMPGVFGNRSMGGIFITLSLLGTPLVWFGLIAGLMLARSMPVVTFAAYWTSSKPWPRILWALPVVGISIFRDSFHTVITGTGRTKIWADSFSAWSDASTFDQWFGSGLGSLDRLLPTQEGILAPHKDLEVYFWGHNDFLQGFVELGIVGTAICAIALIELAYRLPKKERPILIALLVAMSTNFPWHFMPHALVYWAFIKRYGVSNATPSC